MALLAVKGCTLTPVAPYLGGIFTITSQPDTDVSVDNLGAYFKEIKFKVTGITCLPTLVQSSEVSGTISGTGSHLTNHGSNAVVMGDKVTITVSFTDSSTGATATLPVVIMITNAGQTSVDVT